MVKVRFLINENANFKTSGTNKDWVETDKDGNITEIHWNEMLKDCGYFDAQLACRSDQKNSDTSTGSEGNIYYWYNDQSLDFNDLYDAKSSGSSHSSNNTLDDNEIRAFLPSVKAHIVSIVIWSTNPLDTLECIDDGALNEFKHLSSIHFLVPVKFLGDGLFNHQVHNRPGQYLTTVNFYGGVQYFENDCFKSAGTDNSNINFINPAVVTVDGGPRVYIKRPKGPKDKVDDNWSNDYGTDSEVSAHWYDHQGISSIVNYMFNSDPVYIGQSAFKDCKMKLNFLTVEANSEAWTKATSYSKAATIPIDLDQLAQALGGSNDTAISNVQGLPDSGDTIKVDQFQRGSMALPNKKAYYFGFSKNGVNEKLTSYIQNNKGYQAFYNCLGLSEALVPIQLNAGNLAVTGENYSGEYSELFAQCGIQGIKIYPNPYLTENSTISIPPKSFYGCYNLVNIQLYQADNLNFSYNIQKHAFKQCSSLIVPNILLENATYIYHWAFEDVSMIGNNPNYIINFNKLKKIGQGAFAGVSQPITLNCKGFNFPVLTDIGEGILYNTEFATNVNTASDISLLFSKNLTIIKASDDTDFADNSSWNPNQPFGGAMTFLNKINTYKISGYNLTLNGGNQIKNAFIPQQDGLLPNVTQFTIVSETIKKDFEYDEISPSITLPNSISSLNLYTPIRISQNQIQATNIWFNSWKTFRNTIVVHGWNEVNKSNRQLTVDEIQFNNLKEFNINTIYSDFIEDFNEQSLPSDYAYNWVNYQIFYNTKHQIETVVLYEGENTNIRDALLPCNVNDIKWPIQEIIIKQNLPHCNYLLQAFHAIYCPLDTSKAFVVDYSANTNYSELKREHFFHALAWPSDSDYLNVQINVVLNDNITVLNGYNIFYGAFRLQDVAHKYSNDGENYYAFPNLKRIHDTSVPNKAFANTFPGVVYENGDTYGTRRYWLSKAPNTPTLLLEYTLPTNGIIDLGKSDILPNLEVIQDGALKLPQNINDLTLILPWTGTSFRQVSANEGSQIKTIFATQNNIWLPKLTIQNSKGNNVISTNDYPLLSGFIQLNTLVLDGQQGKVNGNLIKNDETLTIGNLIVKQGAYNNFFKWCKDNLSFKAIDQNKIQLIFDRDDIATTIKIPHEFFSNDIQVLNKCDLTLGETVTKIYYEWKTSIFKDLIDTCWYKGSYSDWGINLELANSYCNPIAIARELQLGSDGKINNHHIIEWDFTNAINPTTNQNTIRQYTYAADPFLNSVNLSGVEVIQDGAFLGAKAIREFYSSNTDEPVAIFFNRGLNKTIWQSYVNTNITSRTLHQATSDSKTEGEV